MIVIMEMMFKLSIISVIFLVNLCKYQVRVDSYMLCKPVQMNSTGPADFAFNGEIPASMVQPNVGVPGPIGPIGIPGQPGPMGPTGIPISDVIGAELNDLKVRLAFLEEENLNLKKCVSTQSAFKYIKTPNPMTWARAQTHCASLGGDLAFHEMRESLERRRQVVSSFDGVLWIGANDIDTEGGWKWADGKIASREDMYWDDREPNNDHYGDSENCAVIERSRSWKTNDASCSLLQWGLCEVPNSCQFN